MQDSTDDLVAGLLAVLEVVELGSLEVRDNAYSLVVQPVIELGNMDVQHSIDHLMVVEQGNMDVQHSADHLIVEEVVVQ